MTDEQKRFEIRRLLVFIYAEWSKEITPALEDFWMLNLQGVSKKRCWLAARLLVREKSFGEPKFQDFWACLKRISPRVLPTYNPHKAADDDAIVGLPRIHELVRRSVGALPNIPKARLIDWEKNKDA